MWPQAHSVFAIITDVKKERIGTLKRVLGEIERSHDSNPFIPFTQFEGLHFAAFSLFDEDGPKPFLVFENSVDGPRRPHIEQLVARAGAGIHAVYENCEGYPVARGDPETVEYLER